MDIETVIVSLALFSSDHSQRVVLHIYFLLRFCQSSLFNNPSQVVSKTTGFAFKKIDFYNNTKKIVQWSLLAYGTPCILSSFYLKIATLQTTAFVDCNNYLIFFAFRFHPVPRGLQFGI